MQYNPSPVLFSINTPLLFLLTSASLNPKPDVHVAPAAIAFSALLLMIITWLFSTMVGRASQLLSIMTGPSFLAMRTSSNENELFGYQSREANRRCHPKLRVG